MSDPYRLVYKNGEWLVNNDELNKILQDSVSDSEDDVVLGADMLEFDRNIEGDDSEGPTDTEMDEESPNKLAGTDEQHNTLNVWYSARFNPHHIQINENELYSTSVKTPLEYFLAYFPDDHFIDAVTNTNIYHLKTRGTELKTTAHELKIMYVICLMMGCIRYPRVGFYWKSGFRFEALSNAMSKNRFKTIHNSLHYVNIIENSDDSTNLFWKIAPLIKTVRDRCRTLAKKVDFYSIDEQMIPYTGRCSARQYVKNKPQPVGLKIFVCTTSTGLVVDFEIYQGEKTELGDRTLGLGPAVVLHLVKQLPKNSFVYFDRYFTTVPLMFKLLDLGYRATGTIMTNRLKHIKFKPDRKMERGESQELVLNNGAHQIAVVKWKDTKCVTVLSSIAGSDPITIVKRWNKKTKSYQDVSCPNVIAQYNDKMGGVDLVDQLMEYYRCFIKTKKWTIKASRHFIDLALVNAWTEYRFDCVACDIPKKQIKDLLDFKMEVGLGLIASVKRKRRCSSEEEMDEKCSPTPANCASPLPCIGKRYNGYEHWPVSDTISTARSCRLEDCKSRSRIRCEKCNVYLCQWKEKLF